MMRFNHHISRPQTGCVPDLFHFHLVDLAAQICTVTFKIFQDKKFGKSPVTTPPGRPRTEDLWLTWWDPSPIWKPTGPRSMSDFAYRLLYIYIPN